MAKKKQKSRKEDKKKEGMSLSRLDEYTNPEEEEVEVPKGITRKQKSALKYLTQNITVTDPQTRKQVMMKPTVRMVCKKHGIKESTLLDWLVNDTEFYNHYMAIMRMDVIRELRGLISRAIEKCKETGDIRTISFLIKFVNPSGGSEEIETGWESLL